MSSKRRRHQTLAMGLLASLMAPVAWAQTGAEQTLLDQGQYWQERGDTERAGEAWQKLLRINPQNAQALYGMALVELNARRPEELLIVPAGADLFEVKARLGLDDGRRLKPPLTTTPDVETTS
ncbi:hypothetical protein D9M70_577210 [compost metagenome]